MEEEENVSPRAKENDLDKERVVAPLGLVMTPEDALTGPEVVVKVAIEVGVAIGVESPLNSAVARLRRRTSRF